MQQIWGYFINVRNAHVYYMKFESVRYCFEICDVLIPIVFVL